jgi:1-acyl-sn-glycerol-3-phosphate acyltransferase
MFLYKTLILIFTPFIRIFWLRKVQGIESLPKNGPYIIAANHQSWLDPFLVAASLPDRRLYFLVGEFVYKNRLAAILMNHLGNIKVDRHQKNQVNVYLGAEKVLKSGGILVLFPEGRLTRDGKLQKAQKGVIKMAAQNKVDVYPLAICGSYDVYNFHMKKPRLKRSCTLSYLPAIKAAKISDSDHENQANKLIMRKISHCLGEDFAC